METEHQAARNANGSKKVAFGHGLRFDSPAAVLDTVDLSADEGFLWQPVSMRSTVCTAAEEDCEATVRFCLISIAEYQENPWTFPMAVMLQKRSQCTKSEKARSFHLSTLRVSRF